MSELKVHYFRGANGRVFAVGSTSDVVLPEGAEVATEADMNKQKAAVEKALEKAGLGVLADHKHSPAEGLELGKLVDREPTKEEAVTKG